MQGSAPQAICRKMAYVLFKDKILIPLSVSFPGPHAALKAHHKPILLRAIAREDTAETLLEDGTGTFTGKIVVQH